MLRLRRPSRLLMAIASSAVLAATTSAQEYADRIDAGGHVIGFGVRDARGYEQSSPGFGGWFAFPIAPRLAIESRVSWFPTREPILLQDQGGRTLQVAAGVRGELARSSTVALHGFITPGLVHFTQTASPIVNAGERIGPATHFSLDIGIGVEFPTAKPWALRADVIDTLYPVPGFVLARSDPRPLPGGGFSQLELSTSGKIRATWQASAGVRFRPGAEVTPRSTSTATTERWTAGPQTGVMVLREDGLLSPRTTPAIGSFVSYRVFDWLYADGSIAGLPQEPDVRSSVDGGKMIQALAGAKIGRRRESVGTFFKFRVGVNSYGGAVKPRDQATNRVTLTRATTGVIDVGGVLELVIGRQLLFRVDAGDTFAFRHPTDSDSIEVTSGVGWRF
jgi:hypothetical protein